MLEQMEKMCFAVKEIEYARQIQLAVVEIQDVRK